MKVMFLIWLSCFPFAGKAQELFTFTEPASNMAAKSIGIRLSNTLMKENTGSKYNFHTIPELMWGISGKLMIHMQGFLSNRNKGLAAEGGSVYFKYRFYSADEVHSHFRMAVYIKASSNNSDIHQQAIDLNGHNSGYETGLVATKLINKVAISAGAGYLHALNNGKQNKFSAESKDRNAFSYTFSIGKLMLPKVYVNYDQLNMNFMLELLGQTNLHTAHSFLDIAPSVQLILFSKMRIDLGYRFDLVNTLQRTATKGYLFRMEYNFFNALK